jgi:hypothetical protein
MSDEVLAQARRLHMHVMNGGGVTAMDMSRLVQGMERMQAERDRLLEALHRISLGSQNSGTTKEDLGREARTALGDDRT